VDIDVSDYDTSCTQDSDCIAITAGTLCTGACLCGGATINKSAEAQYEAAIASISSGGCPCASGPIPQCQGGTCTLCDGPYKCTSGVDAGPPPTSFSCDESTSGASICYTIGGLPASDLSSLEGSCMSSGGKVVPSCPTAGQVGCCEDIPVSGGDYTEGFCYYSGSSSAIQSDCTALKGTWVP
jgi:hypothetical protein